MLPTNMLRKPSHNLPHSLALFRTIPKAATDHGVVLLQLKNFPAAQLSCSVRVTLQPDIERSLWGLGRRRS